MSDWSNPGGRGSLLDLFRQQEGKSIPESARDIGKAVLFGEGDIGLSPNPMTFGGVVPRAGNTLDILKRIRQSVVRGRKEDRVMPWFTNEAPTQANELAYNYLRTRYPDIMGSISQVQELAPQPVRNPNFLDRWREFLVHNPNRVIMTSDSSLDQSMARLMREALRNKMRGAEMIDKAGRSIGEKAVTGGNTAVEGYYKFLEELGKEVGEENVPLYLRSLLK